MRLAILSDGKPGHENQSLGIAERIPGNEILLIRHKLRKGLFETVFRLRVAANGGIGEKEAERLLGKACSVEDIEKLKKFKPLAIIAAGATSAAPCLLAAIITHAKTCFCMRPSLIPINRFDLAIIPEHDHPPDRHFIVKTLAAPNRISPENLASEEIKWAGELPKSDAPILAFLIGGPSRSAKFDNRHILEGLKCALDWAETHGWQVWLSTSRRTPIELEDEIERTEKGHPALTWAFFRSRDTRNPVYAFLARCVCAVVTSDSVGMIAEVASTGKGPFVYGSACEKFRRQTKHDRIVGSIIGAGYGAEARSRNELAALLATLLTQETRFRKLPDTEKASKVLLDLVLKRGQ